MKIAVIGAGIAGTTLAYWLRRSGHIPTLIEKAPQLAQWAAPCPIGDAEIRRAKELKPARPGRPGTRTSFQGTTVPLSQMSLLLGNLRFRLMPLAFLGSFPTTRLGRCMCRRCRFWKPVVTTRIRVQPAVESRRRDATVGG